ncbi:hypothetical protein [Plantactinospora sp. KBS50]|uniref:hypothetical protein n=1 Tax=Plantactinospora sp. KBS50 TaxID=2024580 RepID=UPI000BAACE0B|nr:hypothetical protein [Plantactinospora sp. KBS50]ASW55208.1 hypothetical protein CIK06_15040 [Plantactinospora sp. KBS50]
MSGSPANEKDIQPAGQVVLYCNSQYWMNATPEDPLLAKMNCSQPWHPGLGEAAQVVLAKKLVFNWSE